MPQVEVAAPASLVWSLIAEFRHWPAWGPSVRRVESEATEVAPGVTGRVQTPVGVWLPFRVTEVEPGRSWRWRVAGVPATGHRIVPVGPSRCLLEFTVARVLAPYSLVLRIGLRRVKKLAESGAA